MGIFCEDMRQENSGQDMLIGILPDTLNVPSFPGMMPKLGVYVRVHFEAGYPQPKTITAKIISTDGEEIALPAWTADVIKKGFEDARSHGIPLVGFVLKAVLGIPIKVPGIMVTQVEIDGVDYTASNLRIVKAPATASEPPASQSPTASAQT
jgi:hypothetical protein